MNILIPAAGAGSRFKQTHACPKPYIPVNGMPMVVLAVDTLAVPGTYYYILPKHENTVQVSQQLKQTTPECEFRTIDFITEGAVQSALLFKNHINNTDELIIANCDQVMHCDLNKAITQLRQYDAGLITIHDDDPKHSYAAIDENGAVVEVVEKKVISNSALTGIHYWKRGRDFVSSAERLIADNNRSLNEFYISTTYNYLIADGLCVGQVMIDKDQISFIGTPDDLEKYNAR